MPLMIISAREDLCRAFFFCTYSLTPLICVSGSIIDQHLYVKTSGAVYRKLAQRHQNPNKKGKPNIQYM